MRGVSNSYFDDDDGTKCFAASYADDVITLRS